MKREIILFLKKRNSKSLTQIDLEQLSLVLPHQSVLALSRKLYYCVEREGVCVEVVAKLLFSISISCVCACVTKRERFSVSGFTSRVLACFSLS